MGLLEYMREESSKYQYDMDNICSAYETNDCLYAFPAVSKKITFKTSDSLGWKIDKKTLHAVSDDAITILLDGNLIDDSYREKNEITPEQFLTRLSELESKRKGEYYDRR